MFDDYIELQSEQDFVPRRGQDSIAYGESTATGNQCTAYTDNSMAEGEFT